jgi:adenylate cyclase class IV
MECDFYVYADRTLTVKRFLNNNYLRLVAKPTIGSGHNYEEIILPLSPDTRPAARKFCEALGDHDYFCSKQFRRNFSYKEVEIACKYSERWGFHVECEIMVDANSDSDRAQQVIGQVMKELRLTPLSAGDELTLLARFKTDWMRGDYSETAFKVEF